MQEECLHVDLPVDISVQGRVSSLTVISPCQVYHNQGVLVDGSESGHIWIRVGKDSKVKFLKR